MTSSQWTRFRHVPSRGTRYNSHSKLAGPQPTLNFLFPRRAGILMSCRNRPQNSMPGSTSCLPNFAINCADFCASAKRQALAQISLPSNTRRSWQSKDSPEMNASRWVNFVSAFNSGRTVWLVWWIGSRRKSWSDANPPKLIGDACIYT